MADPTPNQRDAIRNIRTFPQLIKFLRDELEWPIESDDFDELTFDYTPEELGIDTASAAKIQEIKRLRPLSASQPWGIFFVKFEPKRLPVVALRRVLSRVVLKKRASANSADRAAWQADDLLFISNYGEGDERQISFAHFSQDREKADLPTLKVLGWDTRDTALHLADVADTLHQRLAWPEDDKNAKRWREQWRAAFTLRHGEVITTSKELAVRLAELAIAIRARIQMVLAIETEKGPLTKLMKAFRQALIHDLSPDDFADMYAQTIAYGLLSARVAHPADDTADAVATHIPVTNPFLKELMETFLHLGGRKRKDRGGDGIDFDELGVSEVVALLDAANMEAVVRDFGDRNRDEDPVIHFYELFLKEYDAKKRIQRGVFYTPQAVVSYIVRSVHELLQTEFGLEDGLASTATWGDMVATHTNLKIPDGANPGDPFVVILDPATGTATFLVEVIDVIQRTLAAKWKQQRLTDAQQRAAWNEYVPKHLLPRLHGFELMMAPYAIAHMKIGLKLYETGYRFGSDERARIYLTNALEPPGDDSKQMTFAEWVPALAHEARAVNAIKRQQRFTIIIGNPPYSINSCNLQESAVALVEPFRYVDGEKIQERGALKFETILQDDYVKFWGLGIQILGKTPSGIISMISNNGFLTNRVLRGVRKTLLDKFNRLTFIDLHGNRSKGEICPDGSADDNVFDINQGVAISVLRKSATKPPTNKVELADLWGSRDSKYRTLGNSTVSKTTFQEHPPKPPYYAFALVDGDIEDEYRSFAALDEAMPFNKAGFVSGRDDFAVDFDFEPLEQRIDDFLNPKNGESIVRERYSIKDAGGYQLSKRRQPALATKLKAKDIIQRVQHRPFDYRFVAYSDAVLTSPQKAAMRQLLAGDNLAFCLSRGAEIIRGWEHIFCTRALVQHHTVSLKEVNYVFPLNVRVEDSTFAFGTAKSPNQFHVTKKIGATKICRHNIG
jgi:Type ISP C-terminal specificity domain